ncbi:TPA: hypothetical protein HA241_03745, partial [Candidatus Woesearchaeota archaeon]|nr:hypothetical protein [Candidatus Woesearchaeota archaeon]
MSMIPGDPLFDWLVAYHIEQNLAKCLPYLREGRVVPPARRDPLREGRDENELYSGVLVVANGSTLMTRLKTDRVVLDQDPEEPVRLSGSTDLSNYLQLQEGNDGAYIYDSVHHQIRRVSELNNDPESLRRNPTLTDK